MRRLGDAAVTAIVGTALLLAMTMVLFTVLNVVVFSFPVHPRSPSISLVASISDENTIIIEHNGGESLSESEIQIVVSTSSISPFVASGNFYSYNGNINDGEFSIGDYWNSSMAAKRNIQFIYSRNKQEEIPNIQKRYNVEYNNMAFVGDDMFDYEIMMCCKYRFCPNNSPKDLKEICTKIIDRHSGDGVVARLYDMLESMKLFNPAVIENIGDWHS